MENHDIRTQIFYLDRIFKILSDGYNPSYIFMNSELDNGEVPNYIMKIDEDQKEIINKEDLEELLSDLLTQLYNHSKIFSSAPKIYTQNWNNDFVEKTIQEVKENIVKYILTNSTIIKTYHKLGENDFQVIEFVNEKFNKKEAFVFITEFH